MGQQMIWQDKRLWYAVSSVGIGLIMVFFSQNVTQLLSLGVTQGLNQLAAVLTIENLASSGEVIIWTMATALGWRLGGAFVFAILLLVWGLLHYRSYRRYLFEQGQTMQWYDWCVALTGLVTSAIPLLVFVLTLVFGLFYLFNTFQAWNQLTVTTIEPMITVLQEFFGLLEDFTLSVANVRALVDLLPEAIEAFSNAGNLVILWTQTTDFFQQIRSLNLVFEWSKVLVIASLFVSTISLIIHLLKVRADEIEPVQQHEVPEPTPAATTRPDDEK